MTTYKMDYANRGTAVIINNKNFSKLKARDGTDVDAANMEMLLTTIGFKSIRRKNDLTAKQIKDELNEASRQDHSSNGCFVCVILTHGEKDFIYGTDGPLAIKDVILPFTDEKCPALVGKPKIFFIQACRGGEYDEGVDAVDSKKEPEVVETIIPFHIDFFIAYSVTPGYASWRNGKMGSWFIQAIVEVFSKKWKSLDLMTMMTRVNKKVAYDFESYSKDPDRDRKKQIPCIASMLTRDVFFEL
ncbi:unnamed protein product [Lymnaea stagnalis]|uniref:Caspase-3 n=1 Tax=Lymnaea stagnalis TaxID=6523 RepID=A0AAV2I9E0_LYMST